MSLFNVFDVAGSALSAQSVRLNTVASNLANADSVSSTPEGVYKSKQPVFAAVLQASRGGNVTGGGQDASYGVRVTQIAEKQAEAVPHYAPEHPMADAKGYIYMPNISTVEEMANMISASRSYQNNVEVMNTSKQLLLRTLQLGD